MLCFSIWDLTPPLRPDRARGRDHTNIHTKIFIRPWPRGCQLGRWTSRCVNKLIASRWMYQLLISTRSMASGECCNHLGDMYLCQNFLFVFRSKSFNLAALDLLNYLGVRCARKQPKERREEISVFNNTCGQSKCFLACICSAKWKHDASSLHECF